MNAFSLIHERHATGARIRKSCFVDLNSLTRMKCWISGSPPIPWTLPWCSGFWSWLRWRRSRSWSHLLLRRRLRRDCWFSWRIETSRDRVAIIVARERYKKEEKKDYRKAEGDFLVGPPLCDTWDAQRKIVLINILVMLELRPYSIVLSETRDGRRKQDLL